MSHQIKKQLPAAKRPASGGRFVTSFRHWRSGKLIVASDYGYKAFFFGK